MSDNVSGRSVFARIAEGLSEDELEHPTLVTPFKLVWHSIRSFFRERPGQIIGSAFILIMLWGYHGELDLLKLVWPAYRGPGYGWSDPLRVHPPVRPQLIPGVPWDNELISFWGGALLLVLVPIVIIRFGFRQRLSDYGLGLPPKGRGRLALFCFLALVLLCLPAFWLGTKDAGMQGVYPFYRPFSGGGAFILYELTYFPFFLAVEFIFRGYLLFGLAGVRDEETRLSGGVPGIFYFHRYALLIQMLSYTAWHLGKPVPELWGTPLWGLAAGASAYACRSIWPVTMAHWLLNVFLDYMILRQLGIVP
jgi:hypothetical protein